MADAVKEKKAKKSWFKGLKSEFNKVIWTDKKTLGKQTIAVVVISVIMCVLITLVDSVVLELVNLIIKKGQGWFNVRNKLVCSPYVFGL